jgi:hypothetical protein
LCPGAVDALDDKDFADSEEREPTDTEQEVIVNALMSSDLGDHSPTLDLPVLDFINFFAKINTVRQCMMRDTDYLINVGYLAGNSRDAPTTLIR